MKKRNTYCYLLSGILFGFLYSLIPMYVNVILVKKIVEYATELRMADLTFLCLCSAIAIVIAELLNSVYENKMKPELKLRIRSDVVDYFLKLLEQMDLKTINKKESYNNLKLIENKSFEQRVDFLDNLIGAILQVSVLMSLLAFLMTQNIFITIGIIVYAVIVNLAGKKLNNKKFNFQTRLQQLLTEKEVLANYYLLPEYAEYIRDDHIHKQAAKSFEYICSDIIGENKKFFKKIFVSNTLYAGSSSVFMEYASLMALGYLKIGRNMITTAQFLAYYRAVDFLVNGMDFLMNSINKLHFNYLFLKTEQIQIKKEADDFGGHFDTLKLQDVCFDATDRHILNHVFLKVEKGDKTAVIGSNASGKTTLLKLLAGMIEASYGKIVIGGNDYYLGRQCLGKKEVCYVPADTVFFQWEKIGHGLFDPFVLNSGYDHAASIVNSVKEFLGHSMLSEGEKKVLMIMRAFSSECGLIILDEPFANLDSRWKKDIEELIFESGRTVIFSTHDQLSLKRCTRVYEMKAYKCNICVDSKQ